MDKEREILNIIHDATNIIYDQLKVIGIAFTEMSIEMAQLKVQSKQELLDAGLKFQEKIKYYGKIVDENKKELKELSAASEDKPPTEGRKE